MTNNINLRQMIKRYQWWLLLVVLITGCEQTATNPPENAASGKASTLRSMLIAPTSFTTSNQYNGTVEALRQTDIAAQVAGTITALNVTEGDKVKKNQLLLRIDAQAANQVVTASSAQLASANAQMNLAQQELNRQQQLYAKNYISKAALDQAEAAYKSAKAQVNAQAAQTGVANTQTNFHMIKAPYDAIVSSVPATVGDMAMPGKLLLTLYDANQLRVTVAIPQSVAMDMPATNATTVYVDGHGEIKPSSMQILPSADAATHTRMVRLELPANISGITPGMNVTVSFPIAPEPNNMQISVPLSALVQHGEMTGIYVLSATGQPLLRQLRLGATHGEQVEVLSGLSVGEKIALEPQVAAGVQ
jgi:membrane fusion protein, multidrug efflux system